ncbi:hypothetical protein, partial [Klebsiella pneumoniae]|uniref:hypothetical protein n=1 Tax=Klebsiella pneumoniae TaxID=573 RepID=UPI0025A07A9C
MRTGGTGTTVDPYTYGTLIPNVAAYTSDGTNSIENFSADTTLYAQWEKQHVDVDATTTVDEVSVYLWNKDGEAPV